MGKFSKSILAGIVGTIVMSLFIVLGAMMGMPKMSPPDMLSIMLGISLAIGWVMHFMIGITFAVSYSYLFAPKAKINNIYLKGAIFGIAAFIVAQIALGILGAILPMPPQEGSMVLVIAGSAMGHIVFGIAVALSAGHMLTTESNS
ncbi:DUF6789 family protein [Flavobacterium bizetiae]|uniref:DUF6789 family protein n=1 Tax=Flavobacterium bizetiae TaxID=2704140 RepID=UPI003756B0EE